MTALRRINLLPDEVVAERRTSLVRWVVIGCNLMLVLLLVLAHFQKRGEVSDAEQALQRQFRVNDEVRGEIADPDLQEVFGKSVRFNEIMTIMQMELGTEVSFPRLLSELSLVVPSQVWLTSLSASGVIPGFTTTAAANEMGNSAGLAAASPIGELTVDLKGTCGQNNAADWLDHMRELPSVQAPWVSSSTKEPGKVCNSTSFNSVARLGQTIQTTRSRQIAKGILP